MSPKPPSDDGARIEHVAGSELSTLELHDILLLRVDVFVVEQECAYPEIDGRDLESDTRHVWIEDAHGVAAYIRVLADPANGPEARRIGRVVTRPDRRGEQLAAHLIRSTLDQLGLIDTRLEAQSHLVDYYGSFGYEPCGDEYLEDGIPHTPMVRLASRLANPSAPTAGSPVKNRGK